MRGVIGGSGGAGLLIESGDQPPGGVGAAGGGSH